MPGACATVSGAADDEEAAPGGFGGREKRSGFARWWDLKMDAICLGCILKMHELVVYESEYSFALVKQVHS